MIYNNTNTAQFNVVTDIAGFDKQDGVVVNSNLQYIIGNDGGNIGKLYKADATGNWSLIYTSIDAFYRIVFKDADTLYISTQTNKVIKITGATTSPIATTIYTSPINISSLYYLGTTLSILEDDGVNVGLFTIRYKTNDFSSSTTINPKMGITGLTGFAQGVLLGLVNKATTGNKYFMPLKTPLTRVIAGNNFKSLGVIVSDIVAATNTYSEVLQFPSNANTDIIQGRVASLDFKNELVGVCCGYYVQRERDHTDVSTTLTSTHVFIAHTANGGATWQLVLNESVLTDFYNPSLTSPFDHAMTGILRHLNAIKFTDLNDCYCVGDIGYIYKSVNLGAAFALLEQKADTEDLKFIHGTSIG